MISKNKPFKAIFFLILFCIITIGGNIIFSLIRNEEITSLNITMAAVFGIVLWLSYSFLGRLK